MKNGKTTNLPPTFDPRVSSSSTSKLSNGINESSKSKTSVSGLRKGK